MMRVWRVVAGQVKVQGSGTVLTDKEVLDECEVPAPLAYLRVMRLMLMVRVATKAPRSLLLLLSAGMPCPKSWMTAIKADVCWITSTSQLFQPQWGVSMAMWFRACKEHPRDMLKLLTQALKSQDLRDAQRWPAGRAEALLVQRVSCAECDCLFDTQQALSAHMARKHDVKAETRWHWGETFCPCCMLEFHSRERVIAHLQHKAKSTCKNFVLSLPRIAAEVYDHLESESTKDAGRLAKMGRRKTFAERPCFRIHGPLISPAMAGFVAATS
eukprot:9759235-Karenia_brevis.AAC.1